MKKLKIKLLALGILATVVMSSTTAFAATNTSISNVTSTTSVVTKTTLQAAANESATKITFSTTYPGWVRIVGSSGWYLEINPSAIQSYVGYNQDNIPAVVKGLQLALNHYGYNLSVDSQFGSNTQSALVAFQVRYNLSADGICGPSTWNAFVNHF